MNKTNRITVWVMLTLIGFAVILWRLACGWWCDDWMYNQHITNWEPYGSVTAADKAFWDTKFPQIESVSDAFDSLRGHWYIVNGRSIHLFAFLSSLVPQWVTMTANGLMFMLMLVMLLRVAGCKWQSPLLIVAVVMSLFICLPWYDHLASSVYCMNYVWTTVFYFIFIHIYSRQTYNILPSISKTCWLGILAFVIGSLHEAISVSILCGMTGVLIYSMIKRRGRVNFRYWIPGLCFALGTLLCFCSPHTIARLSSDRIELEKFNVRDAIYIVGLQLWPFWLSIVVMVAFSARKGWNALCKSLTDNMLWIISGIIGIVVAGVQFSAGRYYWWTFICGLVIFWRTIFASTLPHRLCGIKSLIGSIIACAVLLYWLGTLAWWQNRFTQEEMWAHSEISKKVKAGILPDNLLYGDVCNMGSAPWWLMYDYECLDDYEQLSRAGLYHAISHKDNTIVILPKRFEGMPLDSLPLVPGTAQARGAGMAYYMPDGADRGNMIISFGVPPHFSPVGSVNPIYNFRIRNSGAKKAPVSSALEYVKVAHAPGDTIYLGHLYKIGRACYGMPIVRIDTVPAEYYNKK